MAKRTYEFDIVAKIEGAIAAVDNLTNIAEKKLNSIDFNTTISAFRDGFDLVKGAATQAFDAISGLADKAISESLEAEKANVALANSLRLTGDFSAEAVREFGDLAEAISSVSTFSQDAVKESAALAKQYKLTNAEAKQVVKVAADLAAVQGTSLEEATRRVSQTFTGFVDKSLAKVIPGLKTLTKDALVAGDALALIGQKVQGSAEILGNTFAGATFRAREAANDIFETFGDFITQNPAVIAGINAIADAFRGLNAELKQNGTQLTNAVTEAFIAMVQFAPGAIKAIAFIAERINSLTGRFLQLKAVLSQPLTLFSNSREKVKALTDELDSIGERFGANQNALDDFFNPILETTEKLAKSIRKVADEAKKSTGTVKNLGPSNTGVAARREEVFSEEDFKKKVSDAAKDPIRFTLDALVKGQAISAKEGIAIGAGLVSNILKGAAGAKKLLQEGLGAAADLILPGIGGVVSEIVGVLSEGPEATKKAVEEFANAIPTLIDALAESLPVLIQTLVEKLPPALAKAMPTVAVGFTTALIANIPNIVAGFVKGLFQAARDFVNRLIDEVKGSFFGISGDSEGNGGLFGGGGFLGLGLAKGGDIPDQPQYRGDRFGPVMLDGGETVLDRDTAKMLREDLQDEDEGGGVVRQPIVFQIGLDALARGMLEIDRRKLRVRVVNG